MAQPRFPGCEQVPSGNTSLCLNEIQRFLKPKTRATHGSAMGNHMKIVGTIIGIVMAFVGSFMGEMRLHSKFRSFLELLCSSLM